MGQVGDEGGRSAVADSLVWEKKLGKMGCVWVEGPVEGEDSEMERGRREVLGFGSPSFFWPKEGAAL
jgi:hypothetical protein